MSLTSKAATPLTKTEAQSWIDDYQSNPIADFDPTTSFLLEKKQLEDFFPDATHYHVFLGREGSDMHIIVAGVKSDASHEYKVIGSDECVLQHVEPCSPGSECRIVTSAAKVNEYLE